MNPSSVGHLAEMAVEGFNVTNSQFVQKGKPNIDTGFLTREGSDAATATFPEPPRV
jgi:hypothetical protein